MVRSATRTQQERDSAQEPVDDAENIFEIQDFTIATDWESFIADAEGLMRKWNLDDTAPASTFATAATSSPHDSNSSIIHHKAQICFDDFHGNFILSYHQWCPSSTSPSTTLSSSESSVYSADAKKAKKKSAQIRDWEKEWMEIAAADYLLADAKLLARRNLFKFLHWFNCKQFLLLQPCPNAFGGVVLTQAQSHLLLSSLVTALNNIQRTDLPVFVPVREEWRDEYLGYCQHRHVFTFGGEPEESTTHMHSEALFSSPYSMPTRHTLSKLFFERLGINRKMKQPFSITSRLSYFRRAGDTQDYVDDLETGESLSYTQAQDELQFVRQYNNLFYGPSQDPIRVLRLISSWHHEGTCQAMREVTKSTLAPRHADHWTLRIRRESEMYFYLTSAYQCFLSSVSEAENFSSLRMVTSSQRASNRQLPLLTAVSLGLKLLKSPRFPSTKEIDGILAHLFNFKVDEIQLKPDHIHLATDNSFAPSASIISLLVTYMMSLDGLSAVCVLWEEFVKEIRWHWEQKPPRLIPLVGLESNTIDMRRCLIYQKLQMINYCAVQANKVHQQKKAKAKNTVAKDGWEISFSMNDDDHSLLYHSDVETTERQGASHKLDPPLRMLRFMTSDKGSSEGDQDVPENQFIYVPFSQDVGLMTEDMLEEQQQALETIANDGDSPPSLQSHQAQLKSDMEAFQAANPGCVMGDFVRWYSPADWETISASDTERDEPAVDSTAPETADNDELVEDDVQDEFPGFGRLSARMRAKGNIWRMMWIQSTPRPVTEQKMIFNYETQGERAIHYLETLSPNDLMQQACGIAFREGLNTLCCSPSLAVDHVQSTIKECAKTIHQTFFSHVGPDEEETLIKTIADAERVVSQADSLLTKFPNQYELVNGLLERGQQSITTEKAQRAVGDYFTLMDDFGPAEEEEFIIQARLQMPGSPMNSPPILQRLFANITGNEYRIATAFSSVQ